MDDAQPTNEQGPKKYIRTFASDLEMAEKKEGALPPAPPPTPVPVAPESPPPVPLRPVAPEPQPAAPAPQPAPAPPQPTAVQGKPPPLQTYASDFSDRMGKTNASTATILAAEQDSLPPPPTIPPTEPSRVSLSYVLVGVALVAASVIGIYIAYVRLTASQPVTSAPSIPAPILVDEKEELTGTGTELLRAVAASLMRPVATGTVRLLYTASSTDSLPVFAALPLAAPDELLRNVNAKGSMVGIIKVGGNQSPFFILSVSTYGTVFSALLEWEPLMPSYFTELFPPFTTLTPTPAESSTASSTAEAVAVSTSSTSSINSGRASSPQATATEATTTLSTTLQDGAFFDATVVNHDVRVYRDREGRDLFLYGFWNQETLIIAHDPNAFAELVNHLATARTP